MYLYILNYSKTCTHNVYKELNKLDLNKYNTSIIYAYDTRWTRIYYIAIIAVIIRINYRYY